MALKVYIQIKIEDHSQALDAFSDITSRVALENATWSRDADGMSSQINFSVFTILPYTDKHWSQYSGATDADKLAAAIADQGYRLQIPVRAEFYLEESTTSERVFGGVITAVDYGQESGYIVAGVTGGDYTQLLDEWVVNRYAIPYASKDTDIILGNITPNAYSGVATPSLFNYKNLARNIEGGTAVPDINPLYYAVSQIQKTGLGSYTSSVVSSIITTDDATDFEVGERVIITGTVGPGDEQGTFDFDGNITNVISTTAFVIASFPSTVSAAAGTVYTQETAIARHDYIESASEILFSPVYNEYGEARDIERIERKSGSDRIYVETATQAFATIEATPSAGYFYAVNKIQPITSITTAEKTALGVTSTAAGITIAYIEPDTNKTGDVRLDGADSSLVVVVDKIKKVGNGSIQVYIQSGKTLEAKVGTLCYLYGFILVNSTKFIWKDLRGRYKVTGITADGATGTINIEAVDDATKAIVNATDWNTTSEYVKFRTKFTKNSAAETGSDGYIFPGVALAKGDQWVITGEDRESTAITAATPAASYVSTDSIREVKIGASDITYIVNGAIPFTSGDFLKVVNASPASFNFGDKNISSIIPKKVYDINKTYAVSAVSAAPSTITANYITDAKVNADGSITFSYDDADPGFAAGDFVSISSASPSAYNSEFARISSVVNQNKSIAGVVQANITSASATSFDSATVTKVNVSKTVSINTINLGYDQNNAGFAVGDYVSVSGASTASLNTGYARVAAIAQEDRAISGVVASAQFTATENKVYAVKTNGSIIKPSDTGMSLSPYASAYKVFFWFAPGTVPGISAGDIVTISGITPAGWNRVTPEVVLETGTGTYDGTVRPYITIAYQKIPKNSNGIPVYPTSYPETIVRVGSCKYTTSSNHGFAVGETIKISGVSDSSFDTTGYVIRSITANTFTLVRSITGTSSGGIARNIRNYVTIEIPAIINVKTISSIDASGATVTKVPVVKFRTSAVNAFNVGDIVTTESISSSATNVFNLTDQTIVAIETYSSSSGYQRANNGAGNVFVIASSAQGTYVSGGVAYAERIKSAITVTGVPANSASGPLLTDRIGVITRIRTNTYTTSANHPFKVGDYPKVTGTTSHNINASSQQYPVKYITSTTFVTITSVGSPFAGSALSREYYDSFKVAITADQGTITAVSSNNTGYAERVPTVTYTSNAHGIINGNRVTITGASASDFNITDKQVINSSANVFTVRDEEIITNGATYTSGGSVSIASGNNNGSFEIALSPGMTPAGLPWVAYINLDSVRDDKTPAQTKAASTRIKIEYANIFPHGLSKISQRNGVIVGDSVKVYGTIKNGIITSIAQKAENVTVTTSSHNVLVGDRITISGAGEEFDGKWTVTAAQPSGTSPQTFTYKIPGGTDHPTKTSFPNSPTWSVEFESGADVTTAIGVTQAERNSSGVVTLTTSEPHGILVNQRVSVSILSGTKYEEMSGYQIVASTPDTTTITYSTNYPSTISINGVTGSIFLRDGYVVIDTPNESTVYAKWPGTQEISQRSVTATVNAKVGVTDVIQISGTNNNDINGQYRVAETTAITFFGANTPYGGYFEAVPTTPGNTSAIEVRQGEFRKKQELSTGKFLVEINGRTIRSAIDTITQKTNGQYWVDPYKNIRYKKRKIQNLVTNPIFESSSGSASSSGWTIDGGFIIDRIGNTGPYDTGYTIFSRGTRRPWKKIKFEPVDSRSSKSNTVSLSEIQIIVGGSRLAADGIYDEYAGPEASSINDDNVNSYWASSKIKETLKPSVYLEYDSNKNIESYKLYTGYAEDSSDPVSWNVYGVNGQNETLLDSQYQYPVTNERGSIIGTFNLAPQSTAKFTITNGISVSPGKKYWISARVKAGNISAANLQVSFALDDSSTKGNEVNVSGITIANEWQKLYTIVTVPAGKYKMYVSGVVSSDDAFAYFTDFIVTEINGVYGFSDNPSVDYSIINSAIPIKEYEIPEYSKEGSGVANTVYVYAAIIKADDISSDGVVSVADGKTDLTNTIDNGDIDYSGLRADFGTLSVASNVVSIITVSPHGFFTGDYVTVSSETFPSYNGTYKITRTSDTAFTFQKTIANTASPIAVTDGIARNSYSTRNWSATGATISPSSDFEFSGSHSILVTPTSATASNVNVVYSEGSNITVTPGDAYRFSVQSYIPIGQTPRAVDIFIYFYKDSAITQIASTASITNVMQVSGSWKNLTVSGVAPTTAAYAKLEIIVKATTSSELHYFDKAELVDTSYQQIYSYSFTDTKAVWNANGKIIEASETNSSVATEEEISIAAKAFFEGNPTGIESINFGFVYNSQPPEVGTIVPFIWRNMQIADVYVVKSVSTKLIGKEVFYEVQITGDSELLGRGLLSGKRTAIAISTDRDAGSRTINPPVYPYIRNGVNGGIEINWLHSAGGDDVHYSIWARSVPVGATQYTSSQYKLIAPGISPSPAIRNGDTIVWGGTGQSITDLTINKQGTYTFRDYDPRYSYQFVIRASIRNGAVYSQACYIPAPGSPITQYITPPSNIILSPNTLSSYGNMDEYADSLVDQSEEGMGGSVNSIISTTEDGSSAVFSFDGRGISIYNAQGYTDGLGVTHEVGTRKILESSIDTGVTINADVINTGVLNANVVDVINLNADNIVAGTIDASQIEVVNLNADNITSGTIAATELRVGTGANTVGITADYLSGSAGYAFWAGTEDPSSASPFSIQTDGSVIASNITIVGGSLDASIVNVTNLAADQIIVGSGSNTVGISPSYLSSSAGYAIWAGSETPSSASPFSVKTDGSVVADNISITGGSIDANFVNVFGISASQISTGTIDASLVNVSNINASNITSGTISADKISTGTITSIAINAGSGTFQVNSGGNMTATSANISGTISASAGSIGGFTINSTSITAGSGATAVGVAPSSYPFYAGSPTASAAPFRVTSTGELTASGANITGTISASAGSIGGFAINANSIVAGTGLSTVALATSGDYAIYAGSSTASAAPFSVTPGGKVALSDVTIKGGSFASTAANFIAYAANFANGVVTSAKIASLEATKLTNISGQPIIIAADDDPGVLAQTPDMGVVAKDAILLSASDDAYTNAITGNLYPGDTTTGFVNNGRFANVYISQDLDDPATNSTTTASIVDITTYYKTAPSIKNLSTMSCVSGGGAGPSIVTITTTTAHGWAGRQGMMIVVNATAGPTNYDQALGVRKVYDFPSTTQIRYYVQENQSISITSGAITGGTVDGAQESWGGIGSWSSENPDVTLGSTAYIAVGSEANTAGISFSNNIDTNSGIMNAQEIIFDSTNIPVVIAKGIDVYTNTFEFIGGPITGGTIRIDSTSQNTLATGGNHALQIGSGTSENMRFDTNQIDVLNNGAVADIFLNHYGGDVHIGQAAATTAGDIILGTSATNVTGAIIFKDGTGGSIRAFSTTSGNTSLAIKNSTGSAFTALVADGFFPGGQGTANINHNGNFTMNDTLDITGGLTTTTTVVATGSITTQANFSTNGAGLFHDTPTGVTLASGSTVGRTALWTLNAGTQYNLQRWTSTSTAALKKNIRPITSLAPEQIYNLSLVDFEYDMDKFAELYPHINVEAFGDQRGVIWEQVSEVLPEAAVQGYGPGDPPTIDWEALYFGALVAIQDLNERLSKIES